MGLPTLMKLHYYLNEENMSMNISQITEEF